MLDNEVEFRADIERMVMGAMLDTLNKQGNDSEVFATTHSRLKNLVDSIVERVKKESSTARS